MIVAVPSVSRTSVNQLELDRPRGPEQSTDRLASSTLSRRNIQENIHDQEENARANFFFHKVNVERAQTQTKHTST